MNATTCSQIVCHGHGTCLEDVTEDVFCQCDYYFMEAYNCSVNYFHIYQDEWISYFYAYSLMVLTVLTILLAVYFLAIDFVGKRYSWGMFIHVSLILYRIVTLVYTFVFLEELADPESDIIINRVATYIYYIGSAVVLSCLMLTMVIWINIFIQVKRLRADISKFLIIVRPIVIVYSVIMIIVTIICVTIQLNSADLIEVTDLVVDILQGLSLLVGSSFSLYGAYLISSLKKYVRPELAAKYPILFFTGVVGLLIFIIQVVYVIGNFRVNPSAYISFHYSFLLTEVLFTVMILLMLDTGSITFGSSTGRSTHSAKTGSQIL
eukprot:TRINITY_DN1773_c0_g1_i4.p1 TRINITY_DN1773_c0_g1~~TRINITY_DN1773_c0_g1_i4.p1  ORF type:complete len:321 (-),score=33.66 TRINITY_DN1773_c0_g1_i4:193-1155(-)